MATCIILWQYDSPWTTAEYQRCGNVVDTKGPIDFKHQRARRKLAGVLSIQTNQFYTLVIHRAPSKSAVPFSAIGRKLPMILKR